MITLIGTLAEIAEMTSLAKTNSAKTKVWWHTGQLANKVLCPKF